MRKKDKKIVFFLSLIAIASIITYFGINNLAIVPEEYVQFRTTDLTYSGGSNIAYTQNCGSTLDKYIYSTAGSICGTGTGLPSSSYNPILSNLPGNVVKTTHVPDGPPSLWRYKTDPDRLMVYQQYDSGTFYCKKGYELDNSIQNLFLDSSSSIDPSREVSCTMSTCTPSCSGKTCGDDGCGGSCGSCLSSQTCSSSGQCLNFTCDTTSLCSYFNTKCGFVHTPECYGGIGISCGNCATGFTCNPSIGCIPPCTEGQTQSCTASNTCSGTQTCTNNDWGNCTTTLTKCSDGTCKTECTPQCIDTCTSKGFECGTQTICSSQVNCGSCNSGYSCTLGRCTANPSQPSCTTSWTCTPWSSCTNSQETRTCTDSNNCNSLIGKPLETQFCTIDTTPISNPQTPIPTTCNEGEEICRGTYIFKCESGVYVDKGNIAGRCGFIKPCEELEKKCIGIDSYICNSGEFKLNEVCTKECADGYCKTEKPVIQYILILIVLLVIGAIIYYGTRREKEI